MPVAGIDLGGTNIQAVVLDGDAVVAEAKVDTPSTGGADVATAIGDLITSMGVEVDHVGIGAPGVIDRQRGAVLRAPNLSIDVDVPLTRLVADAIGLDVGRVALDNDVNVATLAELRQGAAVGSANALCVFVGTGVGGGLVLDGELRRGPRSLAGEIGHVVVHRGGRRCGCGGLGHLEAYAGRRSLEEEARRRHEAGQETTLVQLAGESKMKSSVFAKALAAGDAVATELLAEAVEALGEALASTVALVDLELIVLGGGLSDKLGRDFVGAVAEAVHERLFVPTLPVRVLPAALGDHAGAVGAGLLVS